MYQRFIENFGEYDLDSRVFKSKALFPASTSDDMMFSWRYRLDGDPDITVINELSPTQHEPPQRSYNKKGFQECRRFDHKERW